MVTSDTFWLRPGYRLGQWCSPAQNLTFVSVTPWIQIQRFANRLEQNYPNPFNPSTTIHYSIEERSLVTLRIFNVAGQLVRTLTNEVQEPGEAGHVVTWDGTNDRGHALPSGIYFYQLVARNFEQTRKLVLLK